MKKNLSTHLTLAIFICLILGIVLGLLIPGRLEFLLPVIDLVSGLYMNALKMMIYPLVFCSLVVGIHGIGSVSATGRIGAQSVLFYVCTTLLASLLGLFLPKALGLGTGVTIEMLEADVAATQFTSLLDTVKNLIPANPVASFATGDMLQVLVFAVIVGINALCCNGQTRRTLTKLAWVRLSGAMFARCLPAPFQQTGALCEVDGGVLFPSTCLNDKSIKLLYSTASCLSMEDLTCLWGLSTENFVQSLKISSCGHLRNW